MLLLVLCFRFLCSISVYYVHRHRTCSNNSVERGILKDGDIAYGVLGKLLFVLWTLLLWIALLIFMNVPLHWWWRVGQSVEDRVSKCWRISKYQNWMIENCCCKNTRKFYSLNSVYTCFYEYRVIQVVKDRAAHAKLRQRCWGIIWGCRSAPLIHRSVVFSLHLFWLEQVMKFFSWKSCVCAHITMYVLDQLDILFVHVIEIHLSRSGVYIVRWYYQYYCYDWSKKVWEWS